MASHSDNSHLYNQTESKNNFYSSEIATHLFSALSVPVVSKTNETVVDKTEVLRTHYLQIFKKQQTNVDKFWWKTQFLESGNMLVEKLKKNLLESESATLTEKYKFESKDSSDLSTSNSLVCWYKGKKYTFGYTTQSVIIVGTFDGCDIKLEKETYCNNFGQHKLFVPSRVHAIIYVLKELDLLVVADVGSLTGIENVQRDNTSLALEYSKMGNRKTLIFGIKEFAKLKLGQAHFVVNPKICIVCMDKLRECTLTCGHCVVCNGCKAQITECPLCKKAIGPCKLDVGQSNNVVNKN